MTKPMPQGSGRRRTPIRVLMTRPAVPPARAATSSPAGAWSRMSSNQRKGSTVSRGAARASAAAPATPVPRSTASTAPSPPTRAVWPNACWAMYPPYSTPPTIPTTAPTTRARARACRTPGVGGTIMGRLKHRAATAARAERSSSRDGFRRLEHPAGHRANRSGASRQDHEEPGGSLEIAHRVALNGRGSLLLLPGWDDGAADTQCRRLGEPRFEAAHTADLPAQPDLPDGDGTRVPPRVGLRAPDGEGRGQVDTGLDQPHPAGTVEEDVALAQGQPRPPLEAGDQQVEPRRVKPPRGAPGHGVGDRHGQRLHLHHQGPRALGGHGEDIAGDGQALLVEEGAPGAAEEAEFRSGAKPILEAAQEPVFPMAVALQEEDHVDHVLQRPGTGDGALLGDVSHQEDGYAALLCALHQPGHRRPNLGGAAGVPGDVRVVERLHRVD